MQRTYKLGFNVERGKLFIAVNTPLPDMPFSVWRDVGRLAGCSYTLPDSEVFEFLCNDERDIARAERVLQGGMYRREVLVRNKLGPYATYTEEMIASQLSEAATNVQFTREGGGLYVEFDLPEDEPIWKGEMS